jgi:hypothetical protein
MHVVCVCCCYCHCCHCCREKVEAGVQAMSRRGQSLLHTAPHHDDIMLSYHGAMHQLLGRGGHEEGAAAGAAGGGGGGLPLAPGSSSSSSSLGGGRAARTLLRQQSLAHHQCHRAQEEGEEEDESLAHHLHLCAEVHAPLGEQHGGNVNHFAYLTSGFHSVNNSSATRGIIAYLTTHYMLQQV